MYNIEDAIHSEELQDNKNSFYDVFEKYDDDEVIEYKITAGLPITDSDKNL